MKSIYEKKATLKFAEDNNLSIDELNLEVKKIYDSYNPEDFATDDARWARAYRRVRAAFRKKARSMGNAVDGMIVCRMTNRDFDRNQYDYAMRTLQKDGLDAAISFGLVNQDGQPIYQWGNNKGSVIVDKDGNPGRPLASGRAIGYTFAKNDDGSYKNIEPRYIVISKDRTDSSIPVCQIGKLALSITDNKQENFKYAKNNTAYYNDASVSSLHKAPYTSEEVNEILVQWNEAFGDKFSVISNVKQLNDFKETHAFSKDTKENEFDFCVIPGTVAAISPGGKYSNATVLIECVDYDTLETQILSIFIPETMLQGLAMAEDDQGIFILQVNKFKEDNYRWHLGGFLPIDDSVDVEQFFGIDLGGDEE